MLVESKAQNKASQFELWDKGTCDIHFCYLLLSFSELCPCGCDGLTMFLCVMFCIAERYVTSYFRCSVLYIIHISSEVNIKFCVKHRFGAWFKFYICQFLVRIMTVRIRLNCLFNENSYQCARNIHWLLISSNLIFSLISDIHRILIMWSKIPKALF